MNRTFRSLVTSALTGGLLLALSHTLAMGATGGPITPETLAAARALPQWQPAVWNDHPVRLDLRDREELEAVLRAVPLSRFSREDVKLSFEGADRKVERLALETRVTDLEHAALLAAGWAPERVRDLDREGREAAERIWAAR